MSRGRHAWVKRRVAGWLVIALLAGWMVDLGTASTRVPLTIQPNVPFPVRVYAINFPGDAKPDVIAVTENGQPVAAYLTPISQKRVPFSAALVLDTSLTMTGGPFAAARAAAETLIAGKLPRSELALIGFSARPYLLHGWSASEPKLTASLTGLKTSYGTALWDATVLASRQIRGRQGSAKALVVLTDGRRDTTATRVNEAIRAARGAGARVFVVIAGKGGTVQRSRLQRLAAETGGAFINVRSIPELRVTFAALARTLSRQYLLSYSSPFDVPGLPVEVRADFGRATSSTTYRIPTPPPPEETSFWFTTTGTMTLLGGVLVLIALGVAGFTTLNPGARRRRARRRF